MAVAGVRRPLTVRWLGRVPYTRGLELQTEATRRAGRGDGETLLLLEHDPVFTLGRNASRSDILISPERCRELGIEVYETDRGGKVTYHGPGQLVGYPILDLSPDRRDVRRYVRDLEEVVIRLLAGLEIQGDRSDRPERVTSVWVGNDKIAAIGVHIARWITSHGFALNVGNEPLAFFGGIIPCGISDGGVTSIERASGSRFTVEEIAGRVAAPFSDVFEREIMT